MMNEELHPLTAAREARNLSQAQLAEMVKLGPRTIWAAEHQRPISAHSRRQLCRYFKKTAPELGLVSAESAARDRKRQKREQRTPTRSISATTLSPIVQQEPVLPQSIVSSNNTDSLLVRVMMVLNQQQYQSDSYDDLQHAIDQEIGGFDLMKRSDDDNKSRLSRRDALVIIAGLPLSLLMKTPPEPTNAIFAEEFLPQCAASITVCWHLMKGNQLSVVEEVLSAYLPILTILAQQPAKYQEIAASLATQVYRLKGILALHRSDSLVRDTYFQTAVQLSEIIQNPDLQASALISLAYHNQDPTLSSQMYEKALISKDRVSPLLLSRLYVELSVVYAQMKQKQQALRYLCLAQETYPDNPENDSSFLYAEFSLPSLFMEIGRTYLALTQHYPEEQYSRQAWNTFSQVEKQPTILVPERIRVETLNYQAKTAVALRNLDLLCKYLEQGACGAKSLSSEKRRREAIEIYREAKSIWPNEMRVKELADLLL